jgi:hypothetical protein
MWIITQNVLKNKAIRASRKVKIGISGRSSSVAPMRCPVALAQIFSKLFKESLRRPYGYMHTVHLFAMHPIHAEFLLGYGQRPSCLQ